MSIPFEKGGKMEGLAGTSTAALDRVHVDGKFFSRGGRRLRIHGVTYGPFAPNAAGEAFPKPERVDQDFAAMRAIGINAVRLYQRLHQFPPEWFLDLADEHGMTVFPGIAWTWQMCFLDDPKIQHEAREAVRLTAERGRKHSCILGYNIANEISPDMVRWYGAGRVQRFLAELRDVAKQSDPQGLVTYANFPPTEYLDTSFLDFTTINVYLHDPEAFRRYVFHLQNLMGDKPLLLGELGMDTLRHSEEEQAAFLGGHLREATLMGVAGAFVFAWTDDWHTGGFQIEDWAFGITRQDRSPKLAYQAVSEIFDRSPAQLLSVTSRVSVIVCSYNGGSTLDQCLRSLMALDYPDYEVILVDDGSTDNTRAIASRFASLRVIHQDNQGLSAARNVGLHAASGSIIAYTDSDCFVDPHWLTHLVHQLQCCDAAAVGGPNLTPDDGWIAACVAASPGQPTQVLESDQTAEHIPGCNMAFRRESLEAINGFNARYRKAGDDVDVCWRLQKEDRWITFAPGAFVWHHRRQTPRAYLLQQAGYGEAEGLLWFDHPDRFNSRGESMWRGRMYGASREGLHFGEPVIYHGIWGTGLFQTLYQPSAAHWAILPGTLEWHFMAFLFGVMTFLWPDAWMVAGTMLGLSFLIAVLRAAQAPLAPRYRSLKARLLIAVLCYAQPLVRSWWRYRTRLLPAHVPKHMQDMEDRAEWLAPGPGLRWLSEQTAAYWDEEWRERTVLLTKATARFAEQHWPLRIDPGWDNWDVEIFCGPWTVLRIYTTQEDHGHGKRLIRVRYELRSSAYARAIAGLGLLAIIVAAGFHTVSALLMALGVLLLFVMTWWHGSALASRAVGIVNAEACALGLTRMAASENKSAP